MVLCMGRHSQKKLQGSPSALDWCSPAENDASPTITPRESICLRSAKSQTDRLRRRKSTFEVLNRTQLQSQSSYQAQQSMERYVVSDVSGVFHFKMRLGTAFCQEETVWGTGALKSRHWVALRPTPVSET